MKAGAHEHLPSGFAGLIDVVKRRSELLFNTTLPASRPPQRGYRLNAVYRTALGTAESDVQVEHWVDARVKT